MEKDKDVQVDLQFMGFIASLATGAFQHLGKIANPMTGKIERDMQAAKATIDLIKVLRKKTKGNLSNEEEKMMDNYVTNLQLNYVEESNRKDIPAEEEKQPKEPIEPEQSDAKKKTEKDESKVKWSKSYGEEKSDKEKK